MWIHTGKTLGECKRELGLSQQFVVVLVEGEAITRQIGDAHP